MVKGSLTHKIPWPIEVKVDKYSRWYENLIDMAKARSLPEDEYTESHHVIPYCMGGKKTDDNMVVFYAREHYIAHLLLWKMGMSKKWHNKMTMSLHVMVNGSGNKKQDRSYLVPARLYEACRIEYVEAIREHMLGPGNKWRGSKHSPESIEKIKAANERTRDIRSAKLRGENNPMYGKKHDEETKARIRASAAAAWSEDDKTKKSDDMKAMWAQSGYKEAALEVRANSEGWKNRDWKAIGRKAADVRIANGWKHSDETKRRLSEVRRAKLATNEIVPWNKGKKVGCFKTPEQCKASAQKAAETRRKNGTGSRLMGEDNPFYGKKHTEETKARVRATKEAKKAAGWVNPLKGKPANREGIEKAIATKAAKKAAGFKRKPGPPMTAETKAKISATKAAKRRAKLRNDGNPLRDDLMVQQQIDGAWQHMVGVIMLNQTGRKQVKTVLPEFLERWPTPDLLLHASLEDVQEILKPLGMWRRRANTMIRMSMDYMTWDGEDARKLHGIGQYGDESYRIFFKGERFEPQDKELRRYLGYDPLPRIKKEKKK